MLLAMAGNPGTGKTTLATRLEQELDYCRLTRDVVIQTLPRPIDFSSLEQKTQAYQQMLLYAEVELNRGRNVVLDMPFSRDEELAQAQSLASKLGAAFKIIYLQCPEEIAKSRIQGAEKHPVPEDIRYNSRTSTIPIEHIDINTNQPIEACVAECLRYLCS